MEKQALEDPYFRDKKLFPNVDFYSGIILEAMGFPTSMFTPIFALSRTVGWISQWKEQLSDSSLKIGRPRQLVYRRGPFARLRRSRRSRAETHETPPLSGAAPFIGAVRFGGSDASGP